MNKYTILNLGCGTKVSDRPEVINIDWSIYLRLNASKLLQKIVPYLLGPIRKERFLSIPKNIRVVDLSKRIPFSDGSVDVVYHSHMLEHLDRDVVPVFLKEVFRVLKKDGITRIVVPDFEFLCREYFKSLEIYTGNDVDSGKHESSIAEIIEQCVRRESYGTRHQPKARRFIENLLLGDARKRGETHQWMYDRVNLKCILEQAGFMEVHTYTYI